MRGWLAVQDDLTAAFPELAPWQVVAELSGGSQGAFLVRDAAGVEAVAKLHVGSTVGWFEPVARRVEVLRRRGVPAPTMRIGTTPRGVLLLQSVLPGKTNPPLSDALVRELLRINALQAGAADAAPGQWRQLMRSSLVEGLAGYCEHHPLAAFSDETRAQLQRIQSVGRAVDWNRLPADDLVHYDFHPANVMSEDGETVSGIVDWDGVMVGDRLLDVAMLSFTSMWRATEVILDCLWQAFFAMGDEDRRNVAMHHTVLRLVDWTIRHDTRDVAMRTIRAGQRAFASLDEGRLVSSAR